MTVETFIKECEEYVSRGIPRCYDTVENAYGELFPSYLPWGKEGGKKAAEKLLSGRYNALYRRIARLHGYDMFAAVITFAIASGIENDQISCQVRRVKASKVWRAE